jgi:hypothetical protein
MDLAMTHKGAKTTKGKIFIYYVPADGKTYKQL